MIYAGAVRRIIQASAGIEYVGGKYDGSPSAFDTMGLTGGIGTQAAAGDFILIYRCNSESMSTVSGFTQVVGRNHTSTALETYFSADYRVAAAAGESFTSDSDRLAMMVFRGVGGVESSGVASGPGGNLTPPAVTPIAPGAVIVAGGASNNGPIIFSPPADALHSVVLATPSKMDIGMCVGTTRTWQATGSQSGASKCMASIVLAPA